MKFFIDNSWTSEPVFWWIDIDSVTVNGDDDIATVLGISLEQYRNGLIQFINNPEYVHNAFDIVFYNLYEAENALKYLENQYGVLLVLIGE